MLEKGMVFGRVENENDAIKIVRVDGNTVVYNHDGMIYKMSVEFLANHYTRLF